MDCGYGYLLFVSLVFMKNNLKLILVFFFFSSRRRHTRWNCDWSSDVCSSDLKLKQAFPLLPAALGKSSSSQCFIMPERMARTDPMKQVTETIGSGPYRFLKEEWVSGAKAAWAKFDGYIPRKEPVNGISGGRIPAMDRIEWSFINDASTAMAALQAGEQDY